MAITGQGTSTTASSLAWARGPVGATATAGAAIGSVGMAAATITAAAAGRPIAAVMHVAVAAAAKPAGRVPVLVAVKRSAPMLRGRTRPLLPVHRLRTQRQLHTQLLAAVVVDIKAAVAAVDIKVVAADMKAADINL